MTDKAQTWEDWHANQEWQRTATEQDIAELSRELSELQDQTIRLKKRLRDKRESLDPLSALLEEEEESPADATAVSDVDEPTPSVEAPNFVHILSLPLRDPLRLKWKLGLGLPTIHQLSSQERAEQFCERNPLDLDREIRFFGLLPTGDAWQYRAPLRDFTLEEGRSIGRSAELSDLVLATEGVSRCHARLHIIDNRLCITDLGSTNGTRINGVELSPMNQDYPLTDGAIISLGNIDLCVEGPIS